jgi:co-chaperonin GroES (HSP10)
MTREEAVKIAQEIEDCGYTIADKKIAVIRDEADDTTAGGLIVPDEAKRVPLSGTIVMMGETLRAFRAEFGLAPLKIGTWCTFSKYHGALHKLKLPSGDVEVEVMYAADIYVMWDR